MGIPLMSLSHFGLQSRPLGRGVTCLPIPATQLPVHRLEATRHPRYGTCYRSLFLSDLHLGHFGSRADRIIRFLKNHRADNYYLVGDILDLWIPKTPVWSSTATAVLDHLRRRHAEGARLIYIRGNHDPRPDCAPPSASIPVEAVDCAVHQAADGKRYWVVHGDAYDHSPLNFHAGNLLGHKFSQALAAAEACIRKTMGLRLRRHGTLADYAVSSFYRILHPKLTYQERLVVEAEQRGLDGVICGHFHQPDLRKFGHVTFANCGDWLQSFTALAEAEDGQLHLLSQKNQRRNRSSSDLAATGDTV
ncbi:MAG: UDP-2,3-diacylglucosamine diphosphatase [Polymorphum sp.]|nr:UDP-2,3-diacylglucosamine diphosphatase [Polymorphum sp.]